MINEDRYLECQFAQGAYRCRCRTWLAENQPDVLCLQETKPRTRISPRLTFSRRDIRWCSADKKPTTASPSSASMPATEVQYGIPDFADEQKRVIAATIDGVRIVCVYMPNGQSVDSDKYQYKLAWLQCIEQLAEGRNAAPSEACPARRLQHRTGRSATCMIRPHGWATCWSANRNAPHSRICSSWACAMPFACSSSRKNPSAGGTTA